MTQPKARWELVSPERAAELLAAQHSNRPTRAGKIQQYARAMLAGEWDANGETIKLDADGRLLDGQHRLSAIIESGVAQMMLIVHGVDASARVSMDTGDQRRASDFLAIDGYKNAKTVAPIARLYLFWELGQNFDGGGHARFTPSTLELAQAIERQPLIEWAAERVANKTTVLVSRSPRGMALVLCAFADGTSEAAAFDDDFVGGIELSEGSSAYRLRRQMEVDAVRGARSGARLRRSTPDTVMLYCAAFVRRRERNVKVIRIPDSRELPKAMRSKAKSG